MLVSTCVMLFGCTTAARPTARIKLRCAYFVIANSIVIVEEVVVCLVAVVVVVDVVVVDVVVTNE